MSKADTPHASAFVSSLPSLRSGIPEPAAPRSVRRASVCARLLSALALLCVSGLGLSSSARADQIPVDVNRFQPAFGTGRFVTLDLAEIAPLLEVAPQLFVHYARDPLFLYIGNMPQFPLVHDRLTGDIGISVGIPINGTGRLQFGLSLPVTLWQTGNGDMIGQTFTQQQIQQYMLPTNDAKSAGQEDLRFQIKGVFVNGRVGGLGAAGDLKLPTSDKVSYTGSSLPTFDLKLLGHLNFWKFTLALNVGWLFAADQPVVFTNTGMSLSYGLGLGLKIATWSSGSFDILTEVYGLSYKNFASLGDAPIEATGAMRLNIKNWHIYLGAGPGIPPNYSKGIGTPEYRLYAGLQYAWQKKKAPPPPPPPPAPDCRCKGPNCACTPGVNCPCTPGVNCRCTPGVDCPCTEGKDCICEEGKSCACTAGVNCPCTEGVDCLCTPGKNCPKKSIRVRGESFNFDSPTLTPDGEQAIRNEIDKLVDHIKQGGALRIEGHTDNVGNPNPKLNMEYNTRLSHGRAESVHNLILAELRAKGVSDEVIASQVRPFQWYSFKCAAVPYSKRPGKTALDKKLRDDENEPNRRIEINLFPDESIKCFVPLPAQQ